MSSKPLLALTSVGLALPRRMRDKPRRTRGVSLVELIIATTVLSMVVVAVFGSLLQSRRLSEDSISQNSAVAIVQGYLEQMKSLEFSELPYILADGTLMPGSNGAVSTNQVPTRLDKEILDPLTVSTATTFPALSTIALTTGSITGVVDNIKLVDINQTPSTSDDLRLNVRLWIQDISNSSISATQVRSITIQYAWQANDGNQPRVYRGTVRSIRSFVPTF